MRREIAANTIIERLEGKRDTKLTKDYLADDREEVEFYEITNVGIEDGKIVGLANYFQYHKPPEGSSLSYLVDTNEYSFTIIPTKEMIILLGKSGTRDYMAKILLELIHEVRIDFLEEFEFTKEILQQIFEKLQTENLGNNLYNPKFHFRELFDDFYRQFAYVGDDDVCATGADQYQEAYGRCDYWEPEFRIFNCTGLAETDLNPKKHLIFKRNGVISFPLKRSYDEWYDFLYSICEDVFE